MTTVFLIGAVVMGLGAVLAVVADSKAFRKGIGEKILRWYSED